MFPAQVAYKVEHTGVDAGTCKTKKTRPARAPVKERIAIRIKASPLLLGSV